MVIGVDEHFYLKPEGGQLLVPPADESSAASGSVQPEEPDVGLAVDRYERLTGQPDRREAHRWAGLRSFVADPVVGRDTVLLLGLLRNHDRACVGTDRGRSDHDPRQPGRSKLGRVTPRPARLRPGPPADVVFLPSSLPDRNFRTRHHAQT
jgi:hypothetical protein